jgi:hypothetical protein
VDRDSFERNREVETTDESVDAPLPASADRTDGSVDRRSQLLRLATAIAIVVVVAGATVTFFTVHVCDQQLSARGAAVKICRHLNGSDPPSIAAGFVLLALFSVFFTEISGFGVTLKREVATLKQNQEINRVEFARTREVARDATEQAAEVGEKLVGGLSMDVEPSVAQEAEMRDDPIQPLADEYNKIRLTMPSGAARTTAMTRVVTKMVAALRQVQRFDVARHLDSSDRGLRLAGYAYLYDNPDPHLVPALVDSMMDKEDKPFGQYWALRALRHQAEADPSALDASTRRRLERDFMPRLPSRSDRAMELAAILREGRRS